MPKTVDARSVVPGAVHVLDVFHREILAQLQGLAELVARPQIEWNEERRRRAHEVIAFFAGPTREHHSEEERHVLPTLLQCDDKELKQAVERLLEDHAWIELFWLDIEPQLAAMAEGVPTFDHRALEIAAERFLAVVHDHIALEESLLYPQLRGRLKSAVVRSINRAMAARRTTRSAQGKPG